MRQLLLVSCLIGFLAGCASQAPHFIVYRDVPEFPSFVVIPANNFMHEVLFANEIEEAIISCGVKVVLRPSTKQVTTEKSVSGVQGNQVHESDTAVASVRGTDSKRVERYKAYESIDADYMVETYVGKRNVKVLKRDTREVLTVFYANDYVEEGARYSWRHKVCQTLKHLGIQANNPFPEVLGSSSFSADDSIRGHK